MFMDTYVKYKIFKNKKNDECKIQSSGFLKEEGRRRNTQGVSTVPVSFIVKVM